MSWLPVGDGDLDARLRDMAARVFLGLRGRGYGRIDVRSDRAGAVLQFLEMNPQAGIFYPPGAYVCWRNGRLLESYLSARGRRYGSADEILARSEGGHKEFIDRLIACALRRARASVPSYEAVYVKGRGFGLFAMRDFAQGETVQRNEERGVVIASRGHIDATFTAAQLGDFAAYAWPLSERVFVTWSPDPSAWEPINHSCDPNTWLDGLNLVARRAIAAGEEITVEYGTFCVDNAPFDCSCGSRACRRRVAGDDWRVATRTYGDAHVTDWVRILAERESGKSAPPHVAQDKGQSSCSSGV